MAETTPLHEQNDGVIQSKRDHDVEDIVSSVSDKQSGDAFVSGGVSNSSSTTPEEFEKTSNGQESTAATSVAGSIEAVPFEITKDTDVSREEPIRRSDVDSPASPPEVASLNPPDRSLSEAESQSKSFGDEVPDEPARLDNSDSDTGGKGPSKANDKPESAHAGDEPSTDESESMPKVEDKPKDASPEQRAKDAAKKIIEYSEYLQSMEERVASLELKLQTPQEAAAARKAEASSKKRVPAIPEVRRMKWPEFKNKFKDAKNMYAIEALVGEVKYWYQKATQLHPKHLKEISTNPKEAVKRIRINSLPIIKILSDVTDFEWSEDPRVLIYPFKLLVDRGSDIRKHMERLESKWISVDEDVPSAADPSVPGAKSMANNVEDSQPSPKIINVDVGSGGDRNPSKDSDAIKTTQNESRKVDIEDHMDSLEAFRDLRCLVQFMDEQITPVVARIKDSSRTRIAFQDLWHLFRPGDDIFIPRHSAGDRPSETSDQPAGEPTQTSHKRNDRYQEDWRIISCGGGRANLSSEDDDDAMVPKLKVNQFTMQAYYVDFNGKVFGPAAHSFGIKPFDGERDITSLEFYPSRFLHNAEERRTQLKARGQRFREFRVFQHRQYKGTTFSCQPCGCDFHISTTNPEPIDSQVVVDFAEAIQNDHDWLPGGRTLSSSCESIRELVDDVPTFLWKEDEEHDYDEKIYDLIYDESEDRERTHDFESKHPLLKEDPDPAFTDGWGLSDDELILLPSRVLAFVFRNRKFAALHIDNLQPVKEYTGGWNDLKLVSGHKDMLKALVRTHLSDRQMRLRDDENEDKHGYDIVRGKGQGLVVLLHGVPGVGKTSTAECVAESHGKPLFPITCGDLGVTAATVERALEEKFHLAQVWDCVLLLDEADVFLAERSRDDIKRNALVSVFLRVLEYYTGILFLTTNRVGAFDDAFKSRIHLALYFPPLKEKQTLAIWKMNLKRTLARKDNMMEADVDEIISFAKEQFHEGKKTDSNWNGRQIRNAFQTAAALAEFDAQSKRQNPKGPVYSRLHTKHFKTVSQASKQFDDYIKSFSGSMADRTAFNLDRNDSYQYTGLDYGADEKANIPRSARGQKFSEASEEYGDHAIYEEEDAPPQQSTPRRIQRNREPVQAYNTRETSQPQTTIAHRRNLQQARPSPLQSAPDSRSRRTSNRGYPTPDASNSALQEQMEPSVTFYSPRGAASETRKGGPVGQRPAVRSTAANARQPEPEQESDEPDYSGDDDDDDDME